ncbi:MAG: hypothetical protein M0R32_07450 [Candidatus Cloacimonetes bacterium]|jgi:hypothetical protein|nr:hypothetical protein [Candidatus Cloacimonadota bacterium]
MTEGVIYYNRGFKCVIRMIVSLISLRKHYDGPVTVFLEGEGLKQLSEDIQKKFKANVIYDANPNTTTYVRAVEVCMKAPYDVNLWMDADTLIVGEFSEFFEKGRNHDLAIAHFAGWDSKGSQISKRIRRYENLVPKDYIDKALAYGPAINCGVYSFPKNSRILKEWLDVAKKGESTKMFIPDEVACQVLLPQYNCAILPLKYNVSVRHDPKTTDMRIIHYHGRKHCKEYPLCNLWISEFLKAVETDECHIKSWIEKDCGGDRRLKSFLNGKYGHRHSIKKIKRALANNEKVSKSSKDEDEKAPIDPKDLTIVTAVDPNYLDRLQLTFSTWKEKKNISKYEVMVFVNGMSVGDPRLNFLREKGLKVTLVPWDLPGAENQREKMLSAFVLGTAKYVKTPYWIKLDADSYAVDSSPLALNYMKNYAFVGHRWGYSWDKHIKALDEWSRKQGDRKLRKAKPMYDPNCKSGRRYYHPGKRTISFIQVQSTEFTKLCASLAGERLPVPSHDTYLYYIANQLGFKWKSANFKRDHGFSQGKGIEHIKRNLGIK